MTEKWKQTKKDKFKHLIAFHGNNLHQLPRKLFLLWNKLVLHENNHQLLPPDAASFETQFMYDEIYSYDAEENAYQSDNMCYECPECLDYYQWNSSVYLSLYHDFELDTDLFLIALLSNGEVIEDAHFHARNMCLFFADESLRQTYNKWKTFREQNTRWVEPYKITAHTWLNNAVNSVQSIMCEACFFSEQCNRTSCMMPQYHVETPRVEELKINLHILEACNYRCRHCFAHFNNKQVLPVHKWKHIVDNCATDLFVREFNIAGGEPLLYPDLDKLAEYINYIGAKCSIITNGFLMTEEWVRKNAKYYSTIGFSLDSFNPSTLIKMGRATIQGKFLSIDRFAQLCKLIKECNPRCKIKVNSVVSKLNQDENVYQSLANLPIDKWKIIKMRVYKDDHFDNSDIAITDAEYEAFVERNISEKPLTHGVNPNSEIYTKEHMTVVVEKDVQGGYIIVDANGYLIDNSQGEAHSIVIDCCVENFKEGFEKSNFNRDLYFSRYQGSNNQGE